MGLSFSEGICERGREGRKGLRQRREPAVSGDGSTVAFVSTLSSLVPGATLPACTTSCVPEVYLVDLSTGALRLGSRVPGDPAGAPVAADAAATQKRRQGIGHRETRNE